MDNLIKNFAEQEIVDWLDKTLGAEKFKKGAGRLEAMLIDFLPRIQEMQKASHQGLKIVTIAGTNGKGETSYSLSTLLAEENVPHLLWISPHVFSIRERISFYDGETDMQLISYEELWFHFAIIKKRMDERQIQLSYYEFMFCVMVDFFLALQEKLKNKLEVLILEVGIGGRLDCVNIFDANVTAITSISRDHEDLLGRGYKNIVREKLGVARKQAPMITALELQFCQQHVEKAARERNFPWLDLFRAGMLHKDDSFSIRNQCLALSLFKTVMEGEIKLASRDELAKKSFPCFKGRSEEVTRGESRFIFIGSHNLDGIRKLVAMPREKAFDVALIALSNRSYEGEAESILKVFAKAKNFAQEIRFTQFEHAKALRFSPTMMETFRGLQQKNASLSWVEDWKELLNDKGLAQKTILVTGSFYFVGTVQHYLLGPHDGGPCSDNKNC